METKSVCPPILSLGIVQTAYANGASTKYLETLLQSLDPKFFRTGIFCVPTGVKHLHRKASEFDIALYFESNGHGTVIHKSEKLKEWANKVSNQKLTPSLEILIHFLRLFNPVIGDAISDMLAFETCRNYLQGDFGAKFAMDLYDDLYVIQDQIHLERRHLDTLICDKETERFLLEPKQIQERLESYISQLDNASRAFIRPSGTENIARLYTEAPNPKLANELANFARNLISSYFE